MTSPDFRALCAELVNELQEYIDYAPVGPCEEEQALVDRARAALAAPTSWRLARRNGELILQAGSLWVEGRESGVEWNDVPTVNLDELEVSG